MSIRPFLAAGLACAAATVAQAQPASFACPKPGTVETRAVTTQKYTGTSPGDPYICSVINRLGKSELRLFNLFLLTDINNNEAALAPIKAGMLDLLSGRKTMANFSATAFNGYILDETWTLLRKEKFTVGGASFDTLVFDREIKSDPRGRSDFHGHYTLWLAPSAGLWLKSDLHVISGSTNYYPQAYQDHDITMP
jgi:hypothetical protein